MEDISIMFFITNNTLYKPIFPFFQNTFMSMPFFLNSNPSIFNPTALPVTNFYPGLNLSTSMAPANQTYKPERLTFQPAQTPQEGIEYAKKNFNTQIESLNCNTEFTNLVNEGLTNIYNMYKGQVSLPSQVINTLKGQTSYQPNTFIINSNTSSKTETLQNIIKDIDKPVSDEKQTLASWYQKAVKGDFSQVEFIDPEFQKQVAQKMTEYKNNPNSFDISETQKLYQDIQTLLAPNETLRQSPIKLIEELYYNPKLSNVLDNGDFKTFDDILGLDKQAQQKEFYSILDKLNELGVKAYIDPEKLYEDNKFNEIYKLQGLHLYTKPENYSNLQMKSFPNQKEQLIANSVTGTGNTTPAMFIANVYAGVLNGGYYSGDVMALYQKYNGPQLPPGMNEQPFYMR